ncbi:MAG: ABC transporter ATP-binding protein [Megasphaera sp.]|nr:ABC transporter ATP-binding protein [Megasphaera sp.]
MAKELIYLDNVSKSYEGHLVLDELNLTISENSFVTLLGPSGCGKTTTLRLLAGFETPDKGRILFDGKDITQLPPNRRQVNTVFQNYSLFSHMDVAENIAFGPKIHGKPRDYIRDKIRYALKLVNLDGYEHANIVDLSGGQQQRVAIARAIVNEPRVLLLDEPLSALDRKLRRSMQLELIKIKEELGITFVFVTHDQEEALSMSDIVVVMNQGYIQQIGTPESIYNEPENAFVADFIGDSNIVDGLMVHDKLVRIADYDFECVDVGFGTNRPVDVQIRPEDMELRPAREGGFNGVVTKVIFEGMNYNITIQARNIEWLVKSTKNYEPGDEVSLEVDPFYIHIMNKPESEDERAMEND